MRLGGVAGFVSLFLYGCPTYYTEAYMCSLKSEANRFTQLMLLLSLPVTFGALDVQVRNRR